MGTEIDKGATRRAPDGGGRQDTRTAAHVPLASARIPQDSGSVDEPERFERLTRRHRDCLRGVRQLKGSKEIAEELGIEKSTVDSYLTEAVRLIGARNRRDAALQLWEYETGAHRSSPPPASPPDLPASGEADAETPYKIRGDSARLSEPAADRPKPVVPDDSIVGAPGVSGTKTPTASLPGIRLPFRRKGQRDNDLSVGDRLIWIPAITLGIAIGFGMLMNGLQVLTGLIEAMAQRLS